MAESVKIPKTSVRRCIIIGLCFLASLILLHFLIATAERILLTSILPGRWDMLAGGGVDGYIFHEDGTVLIMSKDRTIKSEQKWRLESEQTWRLEYASFQQNQRFWDHPLLILYIGDRAYGIGIGLDGLMVNHGKRVSSIPWSIGLSFEWGDGGGEYVKTDGME